MLNSTASRKKTEHEEQQKLMLIIRNHISKDYPDLEWIHSVPNGLFLRGNTLTTFINEGGGSGVSDLMWDLNNGTYSGLRIEMKRPDGKGKLSEKQKRYKAFVERNNFKFVTKITAISALQEIIDYADLSHDIVKFWEPWFENYSHTELLGLSQKGMIR